MCDYSGQRPKTCARVEFGRQFFLSGLLAAKHDKRMRRGLLARPGPSGYDINQSMDVLTAKNGILELNDVT